MHLLTQQVYNFCQHHRLLTKGDHVLVGVSGGADSLCLLHILKQLQAQLHLHLAVAHLNHQLRGVASDGDEAFVKSLASRWDVPIYIEQQPIADIAKTDNLSLETAARQVRYHFFEKVAQTIGANKVAVGHHGDDQAETVLMHVLRGCGLNGLRGMVPLANLPTERNTLTHAVQLIRPLLETSRSDIEQYGLSHGLSPRYDESNQETQFLRNRLRHELLPYLEQYNPNVKQLLRQTAKIVAADVALLDEQLDRVWSQLHALGNPADNRPLSQSKPISTSSICETPERPNIEKQTPISLNLRMWRELPLSLKRATLRRAFQHINQTDHDLTFAHVETAIEVISRGQTGTKVQLPKGVEVTVRYNRLIISTESVSVDPLMPHLVESAQLPVAIPGVTKLPHSDWELHVTPISASAVSQSQLKTVGRLEAYLDADVVGRTAILRSRQTKDSFAPFGLGGQHQTLKTFMINSKIPAAQRNQIPLLINEAQILWVCGYRLAEAGAIRPTTQRVLHLQFLRPEHQFHSFEGDT